MDIPEKSIIQFGHCIKSKNTNRVEDRCLIAIAYYVVVGTNSHADDIRPLFFERISVSENVFSNSFAGMFITKIQ